MKITEEKRAAIGRAVLDVLGAGPANAARIVGLHTAFDVLTITVTIPCSLLDGRRSPPRQSPLATVRRKSDGTP